MMEFENAKDQNPSVQISAAHFELLLPVGNLQMAQAAIHNGADAIYIGFPEFNARGRSQNLSIQELKEITDLCHIYGVRVLVALNILIFEHEFSELIPKIIDVIELGVDSFIIQDLGLAGLIHNICPEMRLHASTQMTVTNDLAITLLEDLNFKRFVLGRENSIEEINWIRKKTDREIEVFVHGALCVAYSGQCLTSESIGGRSANRGQCAQSCRFNYDLFLDDSETPFKKSFALSPTDLMGINKIQDLMSAGVNSFKIEGRLKTPEYVASSARSYKRAICLNLDSKIEENTFPWWNDWKLSQEQLKMQVGWTYSRGFSEGWLNGVRHQELVDGRSSSHLGYEFGEVLKILNGELLVRMNREIKIEPGDGISWIHQQEDSIKTEGSLVYSVKNKNQREAQSPEVYIGVSNKIELAHLKEGTRIFLNYKKNEAKQFELSTQDRNYTKRILISASIKIKLNEPIRVSFSDGVTIVWAETRSPSLSALKSGTSLSLIKEELMALSHTPFKINEFNVSECEAFFIPLKEIKELKKQLVTELSSRRMAYPKREVIKSPDFVKKISALNKQTRFDESKTSKLNILLRNKYQVQILVDATKRGEVNSSLLGDVILDFEFGRDYKGSLDLLREARLRGFLATTRILKPNEYRNLDHLIALSPDGIVIRNLGALQYIKLKKFNGKMHGDFSLNATNSLTVDYLLSKGLDQICLSYDLNAHQITELIETIDSTKIEITIHHYMPSFHMEHCVFAANLSKGNSFRDCGKPCEMHQLKLRDQFGHWHFIKADQECRNTMFNADAKIMTSKLIEWSQRGVPAFRFEALNESEDELLNKVKNILGQFK